MISDPPTGWGGKLCGEPNQQVWRSELGRRDCRHCQRRCQQGPEIPSSNVSSFWWVVWFIAVQWMDEPILEYWEPTNGREVILSKHKCLRSFYCIGRSNVESWPWNRPMCVSWLESHTGVTEMFCLVWCIIKSCQGYMMTITFALPGTSPTCGRTQRREQNCCLKVVSIGSKIWIRWIQEKPYCRLLVGFVENNVWALYYNWCRSVESGKVR